MTRMKRQVAAYCSMIRRRAPCASLVKRVGFIEEDDLEFCAAVGCGSCELLHFGADALEFSLI